MQFTLLQENLQQVIQDIQKNVPTKPVLPILSCIYIKAEGQRISFAVTDLHMGIKTYSAGKVTESGTIAVPAKVFMDYGSTLSAGEIAITVKETTMTIVSASNKATIQCFSAADYPPFPEKEGDPIQLPMEFFAPAVQNVAFAASLDDARPILTTLLFQFGEQTEVVATDGFRLAQIFIDYVHDPLQLLLPAKAVTEVLRIATRKKVETIAFVVSEKLKQVFFSFADVEILVRLMEGEFPPYQKILPADFQTEITFDGDDFAQKMKTAMIFARESSGTIRFQVTKNELKLISASSSLGTQESSIPIQLIKGGDQEIAFNAKYLSDFLAVVKPKTIWFGMNESLKPAMFRTESIQNYSYVVMPFRVNN